MANTLTSVVPRLLAQGLLALREMAITPRIVNRAYDAIAGERGTSIDVPIPSAIAAQEVAPAATPPATADIAPTHVSIPLDQWFEAPFYMTDKEMLEVMEGTIPMQASEAVKSIANTVDNYILAQYVDIYGFHGTPGTVPFDDGTTNDATQIRKVLNNQLAPFDPRHVIMDPDAEASALNLRAFQDASYSGSVQAIIEGDLNRKLGMRWWMNQNTPTHIAGTGSGYLAQGAHIAGDSTIAIDIGTGTVVIGDIVTFAGHTQTYTVKVGVAAAGTITISPALQAAVADNAAMTIKGDHVVNLAFHRDCIAFATRPLTAAPEGLGSFSRSGPDPLTGLTLRLEVTREHKRTRFSYDMLWGSRVIRPELGARLAG